VSVSSFNSALRRAQSSVIILPLQIYRCVHINSVLFSFFVVVVHAGCDKHSLLRGGVCGKLHGGRSQLLIALQQSSIDSQLFVEIRDLCLSHLHATSPLGDYRRNDHDV